MQPGMYTHPAAGMLAGAMHSSIRTQHRPILARYSSLHVYTASQQTLEAKNVYFCCLSIRHAAVLTFHSLLIIYSSPRPILHVQDEVSSSDSSELIMSSRPPFINWAEQSRADTGWKEAMWSLQHKSSEARATAGAPGRREDAAAQPGTPDELHHLHTADWPSRQEAAQQQQFGKAAGGSGEAGMPYGTAVSAGCCDGRSHCTANALQHGRRHQTDRGHSCSPQQDEQWAVSTGVPKWHSVNSHPACTAASPGTNAPPLKPGQQHSAGSTHRRLRHDTELSEVAVTLSRSTLRAVMRALAQGLADIQELRRTAEKAGAFSDQASSPLCDRSASPHQRRYRCPDSRQRGQPVWAAVCLQAWQRSAGKWSSGSPAFCKQQRVWHSRA